MTSACFVRLATLPVVIRCPGEYVTRGGETVTIYAVSPKHEFGCYGVYDGGIVERWHKSGRILSSYPTNNDIVQAVVRNPKPDQPKENEA